MKRVSHSRSLTVALALLGMVVMGCDSTDDVSDLERFYGSWALVSATDDAGDKTAVFAQLGTLTLDLDEDGTHVLAVDLVDPEAEDVNLTGDYTVNEGPMELRLGITFDGVPLSLTFGYGFEDEDTATLTAGSTLIATLLGPEAGALLEGDVVITIQRTS